MGIADKPFRLSAAVLIAALATGIAAVYAPAAALLVASFIALVGAALRRPEWLGYPALLSVAISFSELTAVKQLDFDVLPLYKLGVLLLIVPCILVRGLRTTLVFPLAALAGLLFLTFFMSDWHPRMTAGLSLKAFAGLSLPFVFLLVRWTKETVRRQIRLICLLPSISVGAGALLQAAGLHPLLNVEFTGAIRLQGASIPPHLAMLAFIGITVALIEAKRNGGKAAFFYATLPVNFAILVATGTRGPILALAAIVAWFFFDLFRQYLKGRTKLIVPLACALVVLAAAVLLQWDNMKKRSFERQTETVVDLSGRMEAWTFFLKGANEAPAAGRGLGAVTVANDGSLYEGFVVPHNEYIRFFYDGGYIGAGLMFGALLLIFSRIYRAVAPAVKPYFALFALSFLIYSFSDNTLSTVQFIIPFCWYLNGLHLLSQPNPGQEEGMP